MLLKIHSDALYLLVPEAQSRAGGYFFLGCATDDHINGPLLVVSTILCNVMVSAAEVELGALFVNAKEAATLQHTELSTAAFNNRNQRQLTCNFIGYKIAYAKANSESTGNQ
eukprot:893888-Ditylum_brightwellii.AAC.1